MLEPVNVILLGKRNFADVLKTDCLEMRSFCISQAGPKSNDKCHIKDILRRDTQGKGGQSQ